MTDTPTEMPASRSLRFRMTIRGIMLMVLLVGCYLGLWAYLQRWEARRVVMYQQRDVTRSIMLGAKEDIAAAGRSMSQFRQEGDRETYTSHWTERLDAWESRGGRKTPLVRATVSGDDGRFSLPPIIVKTYNSSLDGPWLDRLFRAYREKGWRYEVIQAPGGENFSGHVE